MSGKSDENVSVFAGSSLRPARSQKTPGLAREFGELRETTESVRVDRVHHDVLPGEHVERRDARGVGAVRGVCVEEPLHRSVQLRPHFLRWSGGNPHQAVVLRTRVETGFVGLDDRDERVVIGIAVGLEPAEETADRRQDVTHELLVAGRLIDPQHRTCDHRRLDRRGIEGIGEGDRVLPKRRVVRALFPEEHVRDEAIRPRALHQAADLLFGELRIDVQQRDRVERAVPEPLERISRRRWAHEVVPLSRPRRDPALPVALEYSTRIGGDFVPIRAHARGLSDGQRGYDAKKAPARAAQGDDGAGSSPRSRNARLSARRAELTAADLSRRSLTLTSHFEEDHEPDLGGSDLATSTRGSSVARTSIPILAKAPASAGSLVWGAMTSSPASCRPSTTFPSRGRKQGWA